MNTPHLEEDRRFGVREWVSGRWWIALAFSLIIILAVRSGTVGAPAQASARSHEASPEGPAGVNATPQPSVPAPIEAIHTTDTSDPALPGVSH
jgi:hypothetical protein